MLYIPCQFAVRIDASEIPVCVCVCVCTMSLTSFVVTKGDRESHCLQVLLNGTLNSFYVWVISVVSYYYN
jgi:hypothetical protein